MGVGTLGRVARNISIDYQMIIHNCISFVRANKEKVSQIYLYYATKDHEVKYEKQGIGSTGQTSLRIQAIENTRILVPSSWLQFKFHQIINDMWRDIGTLKKQNINLRKIRDLLLPKLISGEIDVENIDNNVN